MSNADEPNPDRSAELGTHDAARTEAPAGSRTTPAPRPEQQEGWISPLVFLAQVWAELRKTVWPTRSELAKAVATTLIFTAVSIALLVGTDAVLGEMSRGMFG